MDKRSTPYSVIFSLNALTHMTILWFALLLLFIFSETESLQYQFEKAITENLTNSLNKANDSSAGQLKPSFEPLKESLKTLESLYDKPDKTTQKVNQDLIIIGLLIGIVFIATLIGILLTLKIGLKIPIGKIYGYILLENFFIFLFITTSQFAFFKLVVTKFIPIKESIILENIVNDLKNAFV